MVLIRRDGMKDGVSEEVNVLGVKLQQMRKSEANENVDRHSSEKFPEHVRARQLRDLGTTRRASCTTKFSQLASSLTFFLRFFVHVRLRVLQAVQCHAVVYVEKQCPQVEEVFLCCDMAQHQMV